MIHRPPLSPNNVKIFVLYLMRNINYPLNYTSINDIVMQNDYIMYLDFAEAFAEMLENGLIEVVGKNEQDEELYFVTKKGALVAETLHSEIYSAILNQSLRCALQYLDFQKRGIVIDTEFEKLPDLTVNVTLTIKEKKKVLFKTTMNLDSEVRAHQICEKFRDNPENAYRGMLALLSGNVNYLLDQPK